MAASADPSIRSGQALKVGATGKTRTLPGVGDRTGPGQALTAY